ncbi:hypothetical protein FQA39_LY07124 [Lamprigera yunnana]|nr:hypothetical protein FQA39_LY07124 [Lamprigera yunnana]
MEASADICELFTCPLCRSIMVPPIMMCDLGHSICSCCFIKIDKCSTCRNSIGRLQNISGERFQSHFIFPCPNQDDGCDFRSTAIKVRKHEVYCDFSLTKCVLNMYDCVWNGTRSKMLHHSLQVHSSNTAVAPKQTFLWTTPATNSIARILLTDFGKQFVLGCCFNDFENVELFVMYLGTSKDADDFYFTIALQTTKCIPTRGDIHLSINLKNIFGDYDNGKEFFYTITLYNYNVNLEVVAKEEQLTLTELFTNAMCPKWIPR